MSTNKKLYFLHVAHGETPKTKAAAIQLMECAPFEAYFVCNEDTSQAQIVKLEELPAGETLCYTDGEGRYYGTVTRDRADMGYVFDGGKTK